MRKEALELLADLHQLFLRYPNVDVDGVSAEVKAVMVKHFGTMSDREVVMMLSQAVVIEAATLVEVKRTQK